MPSALIDPITIQTLAPSDRDDEFNRMVEEVEFHSTPTDCIQVGNYLLNKNGLYYFDKKGSKPNQKPFSILICSPFWPEAHLRDINGKNHALLLRIHDGEKKHLWAMPLKLLANWADLNEALLDFGMMTPTTVTNQTHLKNFLMQVRPEKKFRCVDKGGWHGNQYVFPDGLIIGQGEDQEGVYPINEICPKGVKQRGTLSEWQTNILPLCVGNSRLLFSIGVALASVCLKLINEEGGGFNFKGRSSTGKTKCLKLATSVFGSPDYKRTWRVTANGLEAICSLYNDSLLPLDEFGQSEAKEVGQMMYMIAQGVGKQRSDRTSEAREPKSWITMVLSTGELGLAEQGQEGKKQIKAGQLIRFIDIPAEVTNGYGCFETINGRKDGEEFANELDRLCAQYYGTPARAFIQEIVDHGIDNTQRDLRFAIDDFAADCARNYDGQIKRSARRFGAVYAALSFAIKKGILGKEITDDMAKWAITKCFNDWLNDRGTTGDMESYHLINQVKGLLNENAEGKFLEINAVDEKSIRQSIWGYRNGAKFYVLPKAFKENICSGFNSRQAADILAEHGLLCKDNEGKSSRAERIPAHIKPVDRFYVIDLNQEITNEK